MEQPSVIAEVFTGLIQTLTAVPQSALLLATLAALASGVAGSWMVRRKLPLGGLLRTASTLALAAILVGVVLQLARFNSRLDFAVPQIGLPRQVVEGGATRIPLSSDGHFWLQAKVNGAPVSFMVDTGATLTAISQDAARRAGLKPRAGGFPVRLSTANGTITAQLTSIDELRFGNIAARGLDAVMSPRMGETNVIGMNFLARLKGWRVENNVLILEPHRPQAEEPAAGT